MAIPYGWASRIRRTATTVAVLAACLAPGLSAQTGLPRSPRLEAGLSLSVVDYPHQFSESFCESRALTLGAGAIYRPTTFLGVEGSIHLSREAGVRCAAGAAPTPIGVPVSRRRYRDDIRGATSFATGLALVLEPFSRAPLGPRGRAGVARLWGKELSAWFLGAGIRYRFGRHSLVMDVERWSIDIDFLDEIVVYEPSGDVTTLSSDPAIETERPFLVRVGWEVVVR